MLSGSPYRIPAVRADWPSLMPRWLGLWPPRRSEPRQNPSNDKISRALDGSPHEAYWLPPWALSWRGSIELCHEGCMGHVDDQEYDHRLLRPGRDFHP